MKQFILVTILCELIATTYAQGNKSVFLELGGNGGIISANFDSRFKKSEKGLGYRVGIGLIPGINDAIIGTPTFVTVPVGINYLVGKAPNYFESGLGFTYLHTSGSGSFLGMEDDMSGSYTAFVPSIGYRHAKAGKGIQYRLFISPVISAGTAFWAGISVGHHF